MKLVVEPVWSWPWIIAAIVGLVVLVLTTYRRRVRHLPPGMRRLLVGLRADAVFMLVLSMLRPAIELRDTDRNTAVMYVVGDASRSMTPPDGAGGVTRRQAL